MSCLIAHVVELIQVKKTHQAFERLAKEERAKLLDEVSNTRFRLGEERNRNETMEKVVVTCACIGC